jgi:hypothetical protein
VSRGKLIALSIFGIAFAFVSYAFATESFNNITWENDPGRLLGVLHPRFTNASRLLSDVQYIVMWIAPILYGAMVGMRRKSALAMRIAVIAPILLVFLLATGSALIPTGYERPGDAPHRGWFILSARIGAALAMMGGTVLALRAATSSARPFPIPKLRIAAAISAAGPIALFGLAIKMRAPGSLHIILAIGAGLIAGFVLPQGVAGTRGAADTLRRDEAAADVVLASALFLAAAVIALPTVDLDRTSSHASSTMTTSWCSSYTLSSVAEARARETVVLVWNVIHLLLVAVICIAAPIAALRERLEVLEAPAPVMPAHAGGYREAPLVHTPGPLSRGQFGVIVRPLLPFVAIVLVVTLAGVAVMATRAHAIAVAELNYAKTRCADKK